METSQLESALRPLKLYPLLRIVSRVLTRAGYGEARLQDRLTEGQKSKSGGCDLLFEATFGTRSVKVVVKVIKDGIRVRMLDEACGVVKRTKADMAFLVTPFRLTKKVRELLPLYAPDIQVISGDMLAELMELYGIGVKGPGVVDWEYFHHLTLYADRTLHLMREVGRE